MSRHGSKSGFDWKKQLNDHSISGYFAGLRIAKHLFWILLDDTTECTCSYEDGEIAPILERLRIYDHIEIIGDVIVKPDKSPSVKDVLAIVNLDERAEQAADAEDWEDECSEAFLRNVEEGEEDTKHGRVLSEEEFWKSVENDG